MATINHKTYNEGTETFKDFSVYDGKDTLIFNVDGSAQSAAVTGTLAVSGNATFDTTTLVVDATNNRVGVGTATPASTLDVSGTLAVSGASTSAGLILSTDDAILATDGSVSRHSTVGLTLKAVAGIVFNFSVYSEDDNALIVNPTGTNNIGFVSGNVGIGTSAPAYKLQINASGGNGISLLGDVDNEASVLFGDSGSAVIGRLTYSNIDDSMRIFTNGTEKVRITSAGVLDLNQGQIKFPATQVASADANTLDDYEEGIWTPTILFGGASVGVTYAAGRAGQYTKIGRQVTVTAYILLTSKGSSTGTARISGLPFTITNESGYYAAGSLGALVDITYGGQIQTYAEIGSTSYVLNDYSEAGVQGNTTDADFSNVSQIIFTATYYA